MSEFSATANGATVYDENIASNYYANDQRHTETVSRINPGSPTPETHSTTFSYNSQDELTGVTDYLGGGNYTYAYDDAGNRSGTSLGTATNINEYPALQYNARGDLTNDNTNSYTWDAMDRLIGETPNAPVANSTEDSMGYDAQGRLLWEQVSTYNGCNWNLSSSKEYVWDVNHIVAELDANNNNALLETYTWRPTGLLAVTTYPSDPNNPNPGTTKTYEAVEDASGSVVELVDPILTSNNVVASYHYDPFGNLLSSSGVAAAVNPFGFQQMLSDASGKYYDNARWYDPLTGRFDSRDPAGEQGGTNIFTFAGNDPINRSDSTGLAADAADPYMQSVEQRLQQIVGRGVMRAGAPSVAFTVDQQAAIRLGIIARDIQQQEAQVRADLQAETDYLNGWHPFTFQSTIDQHAQHRNDLEAMLPDLHRARDLVNYAWGNLFHLNGVALAKGAQVPRFDVVEYLPPTINNPDEAAELVGSLQRWGRGPSVEATGDEAAFVPTGTFLKLMGAGSAEAAAAVLLVKPAEEPALYQVGEAAALRRTPLIGTQVDHVPSSAQAQSLIGDYNAVNDFGHEAAIRLLEREHVAVNTAQAARTRAPASARELLADEIRIRRNLTNAPNSALQQLIEMNKNLHESDFAPLHREN